MTTEPTRKRRGTGMAPGTAMEEVPILDEQERAELIASLVEAEAQMEAGNGAEYDPRSFKDRLLGMYRG